MKALERLLTAYPALAVCADGIEKAFDTLRRTYAGGGRVYLCGNGGSAADCQHITGELMKGFVKKRPVSFPPGIRAALTDETAGLLEGKLQGALPCHSLTAETSLITALCNDISADIVFAQQIYGYGRPGDCLVCLSTSGGAVNVCLAAELAGAMGLHTVALTGRGGGKLAGLCSVSVRVPADATPDVQALHLPVYHALCEGLEEELYHDVP